MESLKPFKLSFKDPDFDKTLPELFTQEGCVIITDVLDDDVCDKYMSDILTYFERLGTGVDKNDTSTWKMENLPPQNHLGMFQCMMSNLQTCWDIRSHPNIEHIFTIIYSSLRDRLIDKFICSGDSINVRPGDIGPYKDQTRDWPHLDQTVRDDIYKCVQGQMVLTNTTAAFLASTRSHKVFIEILDACGIDPNKKTNWFKFTDDQLEINKNIIGKVENSRWQEPMYAPKGSFIIWPSTLVHAAQFPLYKEVPTQDDIYKGWRGVVYISYRPKEDFTEEELSLRRQTFEENRTSNHWSTKIFAKNPRESNPEIIIFHPEIEKMINKPELIYEKFGKPVLTPKQLELCGF